MLGHTDRDTINKRRPLTDGMFEVLRMVASRSNIYATTPPRRGVYPREMSQSERNAAKALHVRGMITWDNGCWIINDSGRAALPRS